jgi:nucleoside phosphorylase
MSSRRVLIVPALVAEAKAILSFFDGARVMSTPSGVTYTTGKRKPLCANVSQKARDNWSFYIAAPTGAGNVQASKAVSQIIPECQPDLVAFIGCAGGFPRKIEQYDVVVPEYVHYIARTKVGTGVEIRPVPELCSRVFVDHCKNVQLLDAWHQYLAPETSNAPIGVCFDPIVSGETVLVNSASKFFQSVVRASPTAVAIEMEGYGFLSACRERQVDAVVMRGISDMLDDKPQSGGNGQEPHPGFDNAQYKATRHAAALFFATLDFVNPAVFAKERQKTKKEVTKVSMILDAEMHDVPEIQSELFELFKKYGIRNFSFKPANSVRIEFDAELDAARIYETLVQAGIVKDVAGHSFLEFKVNSEKQPDEQLAALIRRMNELHAESIENILQAMRLENWVDEFPDYAKILVEALKYYKLQKASRKKRRRVLYPQSTKTDEEREREQYFGPAPVTKHIAFQSTPKNLAALNKRVPPKATNGFLRWFLGDHLLDHDVPLGILLALSKRKLFYVWPNLTAILTASSMSKTDFVDACIAEWEGMRGISGPSILKILDEERWDRLGKGQVRDALDGRPATLTKAVDLLALTSRFLLQNGLPPRGCILPSVYVLSFNGVIAGDGVVERMLLSGMAGDLQAVADNDAFPIRLIQNAIRGSLLPYQCAASLSHFLNGTILKKAKLRCACTLADPDLVAKHNREAADFSSGTLGERYLVPRNGSSS